jgi:hypothetical protein
MTSNETVPSSFFSLQKGEMWYPSPLAPPLTPGLSGKDDSPLSLVRLDAEIEHRQLRPAACQRLHQPVAQRLIEDARVKEGLENLLCRIQFYPCKGRIEHSLGTDGRMSVREC